MASSEVALDVDRLQAKKTQSSAVEATQPPPETAQSDGGDTKTKQPRRPWFSAIFNPKGEFLRMWNHIFIVTCVFAVSFDPLFFYIPVVDERKKCVFFDTRLKTIALVLRLLTDQFYVADIVIRFLSSICKLSMSSSADSEKKKTHEAPKLEGKKFVEYVLDLAKRAWAKTNRTYILIDIFAVLPIPQVGIFVFFSKIKGPTCLKSRKLLDTLVLLQFVPRILPIYLLCKERKKTLNKASMWTKGVFNFFLYILASHVLGALWYFFTIQREMDCWHLVCRGHQGCEPRSFSCNEQRQKIRESDIKLLNTKCPIKLPNPTQRAPFDFGIFADALDSDIVQLTDFPQKFLNCFWWGLRNISSLGQNLKTSTYAWENLFAVFISIIGLLLFIYLIGNLQTYLQFSTTRSEKLRRKMKTKNLEVELWLSRKGLPSNLKEVLMHFIQQKLEENKDVHVDNILDVLPSPHSKYIKRYLQLATLNKVPMLQTMGAKLLRGISKSLVPVEYTEESCIIEENSPLNKMVFITHGTVHTYKTNGKGGKIGSKFLEKGDYYGADELLDQASKFISFEELPISTRMVKPVTKVEAFELSADDLKSLAIKYWWIFTKKKELTEFRDRSMLEEFAVYSIEKEIRRRRQGKKKHSIRSLNRLDIQGGSASQKLQRVISKIMRAQLPSPVGDLKDC